MIDLAERTDEPSRPGPADPALASAREVLALVFGPPAARRFDVHLWDGSVERAGAPDRAPFAIRFQRRGALRRMLLPPS